MLTDIDGREGTSEVPSPRERIMDTAISLFASKGYSGTGVREIAKKADVNLAMINYYFGSKAKLLVAIVSVFFKIYKESIDDIIENGVAPDKVFEAVYHKIFKLFNDNPERAIVAITTLPIELPEIVEFRARRVQSLVGVNAARITPLLKNNVNESFKMDLFPPLVIGAMLFHFQMRGVISKVFQTEFNEEYYKSFPKRMFDILLNGIIDKNQTEDENRGE